MLNGGLDGLSIKGCAREDVFIPIECLVMRDSHHEVYREKQKTEHTFERLTCHFPIYMI